MRLIDIISEKVGWGISFLIVVMAIVISIEVILRRVFSSPTIWAHETAQLIFGVCVIFAGTYTLYTRGHISVDVVYNHFRANFRKAIDWFGFGLFLLLCVVMIWKSGQMAWKSIKVWETSITTFAPPIYPFKAMIPVAIFLMLLQGISNMFRKHPGETKRLE